MLRCDGSWDIASHPLADSTGTIHPVNREGVQVGHSLWLSFAVAFIRQNNKGKSRYADRPYTDCKRRGRA